MTQSATQKLGIAPAMRVFASGRPISEVGALLGPLPDGVVLSGSPDDADLAIRFSDDVADVTASARAVVDALPPGRRVWIAYRKGANRKVAAGESAPLHRDTLQAALHGLGLDGVTLVALDEVWSAMRIKAAQD
jgi:hypothetical protein